MKAPRYEPSRLTRGLQRQILIALLVALLAMVCGFLTYPYFIKRHYISRLESGALNQRIHALNQLSRLARKDPQLIEQVETHISRLFQEPDAGARLAVIRIAGWTITNLPTMRQRMEEQLNSSDDMVFSATAAALREAGLWASEDRAVAQRCRWTVLQCDRGDATVLPAALEQLAELGPSCAEWSEPVLLSAVEHSSRLVRQAAVEVISSTLPDLRNELLARATLDTDDVVAAEARARLALLTSAPADEFESPTDILQLQSDLSAADYHSRVAAIIALRHWGGLTTAQHNNAISALRDAVQEGLRTGNGGLTGQSLLTLAHLQDQPYLQVMLDVAAGFADQPMLRLMAARAATALDPEAGAGALINLFHQPNDTIKDLVALELLPVNHTQIIERLKSELFSIDLEARGPAALALALKGLATLPVRDMTLKTLLEQRSSLKLGNIHAETEWKPRGYYLCSRLVLGEQSVREDLELFVLNEHFPRLAICIALLHCGEADVLDQFLRINPQQAQQVMPWLRDQGLSIVVARYVPQAPPIEWSARPGQRITQTAQLIRWWSIHRWQLRFNESERVFSVPSSKFKIRS